MITLNDNPSSKLTLTSYGNEASFTWPGSDTNAREVLDAFVGLMVAHTFCRESVEQAMIEYLEDHDYTVTRDDCCDCRTVSMGADQDSE